MFNPKVDRIVSHYQYQMIFNQFSLITIYLSHTKMVNIQNTEFSLNEVTSFSKRYLTQYHKKSIDFYY